jgi:hypothetical protein
VRHRTVRSKMLSNKTALAMIFKSRKLPRKAGTASTVKTSCSFSLCKFTDGVEVARSQARPVPPDLFRHKRFGVSSAD